MKKRTALGEAILKHWREHCPSMVGDLERSRRLNQAVFEAQERTGELLHELMVVRKMDYQAAWELASQEWALTPEENTKRERRQKAGRTRKTTAAKSRSSHQAQSRKSTRTRKPRSRAGTSG